MVRKPASTSWYGPEGAQSLTRGSSACPPSNASTAAVSSGAGAGGSSFASLIRRTARSSAAIDSTFMRTAHASQPVGVGAWGGSGLGVRAGRDMGRRSSAQVCKPDTRNFTHVQPPALGVHSQRSPSARACVSLANAASCSQRAGL